MSEMLVCASLLVCALGCHSKTDEVIRFHHLRADSSGDVAVVVEDVEVTHGSRIARLDKSGAEVWNVALSCGLVEEVALHNDIVMVLCRAPETNTRDNLIALSLNDGKARWERDEKTEDESYSTLDLIGDSLVWAAFDHVLVLRATDGAVQFMESGVDSQILRAGSQFAVESSAGVYSYDVKTAARSAGPREGGGCLAGDQYLELRHGTLVRRSLSMLSSPAVEQALVLKTGMAKRIRSCRTLGRQTVIELDVATQSSNEEHLHVIRIDADETPVVDVDVGVDEHRDHFSSPDSELPSELGRFVLVSLKTRNGNKLSLLDVEKGAVVWARSGTTESPIVGFQVSGELFVFTQNSLELYDAASGVVKSSVLLRSPQPLASPTSQSVSSKNIWLVGGGWHRRSQSAVAAVSRDLATVVGRLISIAK